MDYLTGEAEYRDAQFYRADQLGGLKSGETLIGTPVIVATDAAGNDVTSEMVAYPTVVADTAVRYLFKATRAGTFAVVVGCATSARDEVLKMRFTLTVEEA